MNYSDRAREIIAIEMEGLARVRDGLGEDFEKAVQGILDRVNAGGKVVITGLGKSLHVGQKMASTLTSTGTPAVTLHPSEAMHGDLGMIQRGDVLMAVSFSGGSEELLTLIPLAHRIDVPVVALTRDATTPLAQASDLCVPIPVAREACPFNLAPTSSSTATLALGDALAIVLLEARGFKKEDYAKLHPGGAIGRALLLRVADIMRTGERLATVPRSATVKDAVLAMTGARSGSVAVVDGDDVLLGIFTDGDLRRHITDSANPAALAIEDVMTRNPITLQEDQLAVDVLSVFEAHQIDDLVVVDGHRRVVGLVDIQDLPKLKIL
jgi:arabinose-5-phosphate isomerase